ncbi:esterase E4-like [Battus philenor]|uniref:esterase E4-like n=1 Tax=Battus philenor TaxID=42288 RepID=UPI0035D012A3
MGLKSEAVIVVCRTTDSVGLCNSVRAAVAISRHTNSRVHCTDETQDAIARFIDVTNTSTGAQTLAHNLWMPICSRDEEEVARNAMLKTGHCQGVVNPFLTAVRSAELTLLIRACAPQSALIVWRAALWTECRKVSEVTPCSSALVAQRARCAAEGIMAQRAGRSVGTPCVMHWLLMLALWCGRPCGCSSWLAFTPALETRQGLLRGVRSPSGQNSYYGIPYARSERFQPPREPRRWKGVLEAVDRFGSCPQMLLSLVVGAEECLALDVHAPAHAPPRALLPVLVFIHGGAYYYGTKAHYDPEYLVLKGVVVVVINYRLNVLGFLCVNGISNLGLRDQVAALKWVKENISAFGGDPDNVTLCGQSAGASAVTMHMIAPSSRGLFHKAIAMSGSAFAPWAFNLEPYAPALRDARKLAPAHTERDVYEVFLNSSLDNLIRATRDTSVDPRHFKYSPCMDSNATDPFFSATPYDAFARGDFARVPLMVGHAEEEGILFYGLADQDILRKMDDSFPDRLPSVFSWCPGNREMVGASLRAAYFGTRNITRRAAGDLVRFYSDWIVRGTHDDFVRLAAAGAPVYSYVFAYRGGRNFASLIAGLGAERTTHSDDIFYVFKPGGLPLPLSPADAAFVHRFTLLIANFMEFGDPTPPGSKLPFLWPRTDGHSALRLGGTEERAKRSAAAGAEERARGSAAAGAEERARGSAAAGAEERARGSAAAGAEERARGSAAAGAEERARGSAAAGAEERARGCAAAGAEERARGSAAAGAEERARGSAAAGAEERARGSAAAGGALRAALCTYGQAGHVPCASAAVCLS